VTNSLLVAEILLLFIKKLSIIAIFNTVEAYSLPFRVEVLKRQLFNRDNAVR